MVGSNMRKEAVTQTDKYIAFKTAQKKLREKFKE